MGKTSRRKTRSRKAGSAMIEFAVVAPALVMLFFGTVSFGLMLGRYIQAVQVCRDLTHMYSDGIDFSQAGYQNIALQLAQGSGMTATGGNGVAIFSQVMTVYQSDCNAAGFQNTCQNLGQSVFTQRLYIGNQSLRSSAFGTPAAALMNGQGDIASSVYLQNTNSSVIANGFTALLTASGQTGGLPQGQVAYVVEVFFTYPDISYLGNSTNGGAYVRFIF
jgi:Flp pilus assembly protein TadG